MPTRTHDYKSEVEALVAELAQAKVEEEQADAALTAKLEELKPQLQPLEEAKAATKTRVAKLRDKIKEKGGNVEKADLHPALTFRTVTEITYDPAEMFQWCVLFNPSLLSLSDSNIKQHVTWVQSRKTQKGIFFGTDGRKPLIPMPVEVQEVKTVTIATDLSKWTPKPEPEPEQAEAQESAEVVPQGDPLHFPGGTKDDLDAWVAAEVDQAAQEAKTES